MSKFLLTIAFVLTVPCLEVSFAGASSFQEGLKLYESGQFASAETAFSAALHEAPTDSAVLFNLALTHIQQKKWGMALADLRQTEILAPRTPGLAPSMRFIQTNAKLNGTLEESTFLNDYHSSLGHFLRLPETLLIHLCLTAALLFFGSQVFLRRRQLMSRGEKAPPLRASLKVLGLSWIVFSLFTTLKIVWSFDDHATIIKPGFTSIRSGPLAEAAELATAPEGAAVVVKTTYDNWAQIRFGDLPVGWVPKSDLLMIGPQGLHR